MVTLPESVDFWKKKKKNHQEEGRNVENKKEYFKGIDSVSRFIEGVHQMHCGGRFLQCLSENVGCLIRYT